MNLVGCTAQLWRGGLNMGRARLGERPQADLPPVARPDAARVVAGGTVESDVLGNDADPEGRGLTVTGATADVGDVTVQPDGTLAYTAPTDFSGAATITYTVADPAGNASEATVTVEVVRLAVAEGEVAGEFVVSSAPGTLTVTIIEPAEDAGDYGLDTTELATGPVALRPPQVAGPAEVGATLTARTGLWAFDEAQRPLALAQQWMRGESRIEGATGESYAVAAADAGQTLRLIETAETRAGSRQAESERLAVPAAPATQIWTPRALPGLAIWIDASDPVSVPLANGATARLADKSGNGRDLAPVGDAPAPTLEASLGGRPMLRFPNRGILRSIGPALPDLPGMPGVTVITVTQAHRPESFSECVCLQNAAIAAGRNLTLQTGYAMMWFGNGNRYWPSASGPAVSVARYPANGTHAGAELWRDGTKLAPTATGKSGNSVALPADTFFQIGNQDGPSSEQGEHMLVIGPLNTTDRQKAEGYLAHKWGLAGQLPGGHPHKAAPPSA